MAQLVPRIASLGHEVAISAFAGLQGTTSGWEGFPVLPGGMDAYGNDILAGHVKAFGADLLITLMDAWVLDIGMVAGLGVPAACWMPVDCVPLSVMDREFLRRSGARPIAMSEHGKAQLEVAGFAASYAPHGILTEVFAPQDKKAARRALGVDEDAYVIGINASNIDAVRKGFPEQLTAFTQFRKNHPDALLLIHSHPTGPGSGVNLNDIIGRLGIGPAVRWTNSYRYTCGGYAAREMARWYASLDLLSACSYGEGFGLPSLEAASCGVRSVVTDFSAMPQVAGPSAFLVGSEPFWNYRHAAWWAKPLVDGIADAYEQAFQSPSDPGKLREHALGYDADTVFAESWVPIIDGLAEQR